MFLRADRVIFLAVFCTMLHCAQCNSEDDADDDEALREALLLIKLIRRAGFSDASHEKHYLSKHGAISGPMSPDPPQTLSNVSSYRDTFRPEQNYRRSMSDGHNMQPERDGLNSSITNGTNDVHLIASADIKNQTVIEDHPRDNNHTLRNVADVKNHAVTEDNSRDIKNHSEIEDHHRDNTTTRLTSAKAKLEFKKTPLKSNVVHTTKIKSVRNSVRPNYKNNYRNIIRNSNKVNYQSLNKTKAKILKLNKDPVMAQVESELKLEMNSVEHTNKRLKLEAHPERDFRLKTTKPQTTLRIHLKASSTYPIPFPVNHALCYTDPKNGLCRTPI